MTTPPRPAAPAARPATALPDAITYVLLGAAALITDDRDTGTPGLPQAGADCACAMHGLPASLAPGIYRRAALCLARASGYQPLDTADPVIDRALDELPGYPPERQARLLTYAARRAGTSPRRDEPPKVNWGSKGSVPAADAALFAETLTLASRLAMYAGLGQATAATPDEAARPA
jgi:hypothetical protein